MPDEIKGMFGGKDKPDCQSGYALYEKGMAFNNSIKLNETIRVNENFYIGKQWEGVQANGLPTPQFNFLKRVTPYLSPFFNDSLENSPRIGEIVFHSWNREFPPIGNAHEILDFLHVRDDFLQIENRTGLRVERYA